MRIALVFGLPVFLFACSGGGNDPSPSNTHESQTQAPPSSSSSGGQQQAAPDASTPGDKPCVEKGAVANEQGVGAYCDAVTKCPSDRICTADFGAGAGATFCTKICTTDADCGSGAFCYAEARGSGCVLNACK